MVNMKLGCYAWLLRTLGYVRNISVAMEERKSLKKATTFSVDHRSQMSQLGYISFGFRSFILDSIVEKLIFKVYVLPILCCLSSHNKIFVMGNFSPPFLGIDFCWIGDSFYFHT